MKSMNDNSNNNNEGSENDNNNQNWLGFSLSPHMKMEQLPSPPAHLHHHHPSVSTSFCLSPSQLTPYGLCYGAPDNTGFHPPLTVMPLKSDGSLCIMEALTRSQTQGIYSMLSSYTYMYVCSLKLQTFCEIYSWERFFVFMK